MAHVLIGFAEALPAPEVVFSLLSAGHRVSAFARSVDIPLQHLPLERLHTITAPERHVDEAIRDLTAILDANDAPDFVLPMDDTALWLTHAIEATHFDRIVGATGASAEVALNKAMQIEAARNAGLAVPETTVVPNETWTGPYPAIAKAALAVARAGDELNKGGASYLLGAQDALPGDVSRETPYLVQPLVPGVGEGVFGLAGPGGVVAWSGHRRLRMMNPHGSGSSACESLMPEPDLQSAIERFVVSIGWRGPFMVELLRDDAGTPWFMELNGRMWGSMALARRQGLEYPAWSVAQKLDVTFVPDIPSAPASPLVMRHLGRELLHLAFTARGPKTPFHRKGWPRLMSSLPAVMRPTSAKYFYNHDPAHPRYYWRDALWTVRKAFQR